MTIPISRTSIDLQRDGVLVAVHWGTGIQRVPFWQGLKHAWDAVWPDGPPLIVLGEDYDAADVHVTIVRSGRTYSATVRGCGGILELPPHSTFKEIAEAVRQVCAHSLAT